MHFADTYQIDKFHLKRASTSWCLLVLWKVKKTFTLWGDKVSMLTHIYLHKPQRKIELTICKITRLTAHFMCGLMSDLLICKFIKTYGHTWHRMSLLRPGVIKPHKTKPNQRKHYGLKFCLPDWQVAYLSAKWHVPCQWTSSRPILGPGKMFYSLLCINFLYIIINFWVQSVTKANITAFISIYRSGFKQFQLDSQNKLQFSVNSL